ncbi:MAG: hypothetical protein GY702_03605 [Desulfobulbaceae bacterium]|nr:hypothetical protein [Desulfobulbaceae bacterium]
MAKKSTVMIDNSLPLIRLKAFCDNFDTIQWDKWEKVGLVYSETQAETFKAADMQSTGGKLVIKTKKGCFSKGGIASTFILQGDFDIQIDCRVNFIKGPQGFSQVVVFGVYEKDVEKRNMKVVQVGLSKKKLWFYSYAFSNYRRSGRFAGGRGEQIGKFDGTLRLVRKKNQVTTMYRRFWTSKWTTLSNYPFTDRDAFIGFKVQNFVGSDKSIEADSQVIVILDNFQVNGAQGIVESEI